MNDWQAIGLAMLGISLIAGLSIAIASVRGTSRYRSMVDNENRRRAIVVARYFDDDEPVRVFRDEDGLVTSVHRARDGEAVIFSSADRYASHTYTGTGHAAR